jgi:hypothetical protein
MCPQIRREGGIYYRLAIFQSRKPLNLVSSCSRPSVMFFMKNYLGVQLKVGLVDKEKYRLHVIPAKAGIQQSPRSGESFRQSLVHFYILLDSRLRGNDTERDKNNGKRSCFHYFFITSGIAQLALLIVSAI